MDDGMQSNAMTEIALALAMSFFSIMVLTMVSMGAGAPTEAAKAQDGTAKQRIATLTVAAPVSDQSAETVRLNDKDRLAVFYAGHFLDAEMRPIAVSEFSGAERVILAVSPELSFHATQAARAAVPAERVIVTTLSQDWLERLGEIK
jgi:hypothetical protein